MTALSDEPLNSSIDYLLIYINKHLFHKDALKFIFYFVYMAIIVFH